MSRRLWTAELWAQRPLPAPAREARGLSIASRGASRQPGRMRLRATCRWLIAPPAVVLAAVVLGGCSKGSGPPTTPAPIQRVTSVLVHDAADNPVAGEQVLFVRLDVLELIPPVPTNSAGVAALTLA